MVVDTIKDNLCVNKLVTTKKEIIIVEGDMIVPDLKPDVLNIICTSGVVCINKKDIFEDRIRLDGNIDTNIMYMADDEKDKIRGLSTCLSFSENIQVSECNEEMNCKLCASLKSIESKIINGRKVGIKAAIEVELKIYATENVEIVNEVKDSKDIKMLKKDININSLVGKGSTKIYAKDTIAIERTDNLAEILKSNVSICDKDIKISYNKILTKAEAEVKLMYLTEDNRIEKIETKIPVVGFIDIQNVTEGNICDTDYEIKNVILKPNSAEEHSVYFEMEVEVNSTVYEEKSINIIRDLYSPSEILEINKRNINVMTEKNSLKINKQISEKVVVEGIENKNIIDVDINPIIQKETSKNNRSVFEGEIELTFILSNNDLQMDIRKERVPFEIATEEINDIEKIEKNIEMEIVGKNFIIQEGGVVTVNIDISVDIEYYKKMKIDLINEINTNGEREIQDYSILMYIVKKGDSLWKIAKRFGSTVEDIATLNGIEDENSINIGQKIFIPNYKKEKVIEYA